MASCSHLKEVDGVVPHGPEERLSAKARPKPGGLGEDVALVMEADEGADGVTLEEVPDQQGRSLVHLVALHVGG
jgi:hypothetical protein